MVKIIDVIGKKFALTNIVKKINGVRVEIKNYIDADTFANIVQTVALTCFKGGAYCAENREIARRFVVLQNLTNIEVDEENINEVFKMTQGGDWYDQIASVVYNLPVWSEIELAIDRQIDYLIATRETPFDKLCADLSTLTSENNLKEVKEVITEVNKVDKDAFVQAVLNKTK